MTQPPPAGPTPPPGPGWSGADEIHDGLPSAPAEPGATGGRRLRRGLLVAGATAGVLVIGGTGYAVASYVSGGGAQPEEALPADTLAFVKVDLDPAAGQKMAVSSLMKKFPSLTQGGDDGDLKSTLITPLLADNDWGLTYDRDVEPWLGNRMAVAAVPDPGSEAGVAPVVVLAVTDEDEMTKRLGAVTDADFAFAVRDDFVLLGQTQELVDRLAASSSTLDSDADYDADRDALDGDQVAVAWADLAGLQGVVPMAQQTLGDEKLSGRVVLGVHAEDDALEVTGLARGTAPTAASAAGGPTALVTALPADSVAALSVSGLGESLTSSWGQLEDSGALAEFQDQIDALGLDLPDDLGAVLGSDLAVAVSGDLSAPSFGARVRTDDPQRATDVLDSLLADADLPVGVLPLDDGYVLASDQELADALSADGGLGDTASFRAAVPDLDDARAVGFVDLGRVIDQVIAQGGDDATQAQDYAALGAVGFSASTADDGGRFVLRVTTR
ncbi:DUF3352 domain-containing protein [Modestobacter sp. L9-4]|uniref:DUF3352 domain-containing protein n=1 Tax=Modestobacter sp. L9-4 TaxID=2851567 RepID=UPI001C750F68|nr:DUF3352 domain-containing protein [Modestobacter sp. L9-4]QXG74541.1 DUF3352 domain-containing protein [Modestobacter sp. L9-4]